MSAATVQLFASYAELLGANEIEIPLSGRSTVRDLVAYIRSRPGAQALPENLRVAVNRSFADPDQSILPQDEIALIPPMAGG